MNQSPPFKGSLGQYYFVETEDKSLTLFSEAFNEACHSTHGARAETRQIYLEGCKLKEKLEEKGSGPLKILEIGFGTGLGILETNQYLNELSCSSAMFITTEIDEELVSHILKSDSFKEFGPVQKARIGLSSNQVWTTENKSFSLIILIGDARHTLSHPQVIAELSGVDAIFQDAFSPKRNPLLWSVEWFSLLKNHWSLPSCTLSTYSASNSIRKALKEAGWAVEIAPGFGPKRQSTRATLHGEVSADLEHTLERSGANPVSDSELAELLRSLL